MASTTVAVPRPAARSRLLAFLEREGLVVAIVSAYAASVAYRLPWRIAQDAWLALLGLPLLALWANIHGSVVLGAALVTLHGALLVLRREFPSAIRARGALLTVGSALALVATPWFVGTLGYYHSTLFNTTFKNIL